MEHRLPSLSMKADARESKVCIHQEGEESWGPPTAAKGRWLKQSRTGNPWYFSPTPSFLEKGLFLKVRVPCCDGAGCACIFGVATEER